MTPFALRTRLLVSVRSAAEARIALEAGAALIDVKEPARGALGAADPETIGCVVTEIAGRVPVSAALGELMEDYLNPASLPRGVTFAKLGLAGSADGDWLGRWREALARFPANVESVAVAYADWRAASAPPPDEVLSAALRFRGKALLIDTYDKASGDLLQKCQTADLARLVKRARDAGLVVVLGGSLSPASVPAALTLEPDYIAVRSAACAESRTGAICAQRVAKLVELIST